MKSIVLVGVNGDSGFAALRTRHFASALGSAVGSDHVRVVDYRDDVATAVRNSTPAAVVTASNYGPTKAALSALVGFDDVPLWLDVAGDPFAEAQAYAQMVHPSESAESTEQQRRIADDARRVWNAAIARADAFSVVCDPARYSLIGALGAVGRLPLLSLGGEAIHVVPVAMDFLDAPSEPRPPGHRVVLVGGFNTWFDDDTLLAGLLFAMARAPVEVVVCGGPISGHYEQGFERFQTRALASGFAERFSFRGWVPHDQLAGIVDTCSATVVLDRPGPEAELGSRTRLLYAVHRGLRVLATTRSPLGRELAAAGAIEEIPAECEVGAGAARRALAVKLAAGVGGPPAEKRLAAEQRYSLAATTAPLLEWARSPVLSVRGPTESVQASLSAELDVVKAELAALRGSPSFRILDGIKRRIGG